MSEPTIEKRRQRRFILMTTDGSIADRVRSVVPVPWEMVLSTDLEELGDWHDVLLYRFLVIDLDESDAFDPIDVIRQIRTQFQINIAVLCFGGDVEIRDEMRLSRADRFFGREEILEKIPLFFDQYGWD